MSRILAIDYGKKNIGFAFSDKEKKFAFPYKVVENKFSELKKFIKEIIKEKNISDIVIGLPKTLEGKPHEISAEIIKFAEKLKKEFNLYLHFEEERFTSAQARRLHGIKPQNHAIAASFILENFLERKKIRH